MNKKILAVPFLALATLTLSACEGSIAEAVTSSGGSKFKDGIKIGTTDSDPGEYSGVTLAGPDNVIFTTGNSFSIRAEGDKDALDELRYKVSDGQLKIARESEGMNWGSSGKVTVYISAPALESAKLAGSGDLQVDAMSGDSTELSIAGAGNIKVDKVETNSLSAKIAGSGDVSVAGTAKSTKVSIAGSGDVSGKDLKSETADISIAGSGDVTLSSDGTVDAKVMGSGDIRVHGNAKCNSKAMGSGEITCG